MHAGVELSWVASGALTIEWSGREHRLAPGDIIVVPAGQSHTTRFHADVVAWSIKLDQKHIDSVREIANLPPVRAGLHQNQSRILSLSQLLCEEAAEPSPAARLAAGGLIDALTVELLRSCGKRDASESLPRLVRRALEIFDDEIDAPIRIDDVAKRLGVSRFHLTRICRDHTGRSAHELLRHRRLRRAHALLQQGDTNVTATALAVGYSDPGRFSRAFRKEFGVLPSQLRQSSQSR